MSARLPIDKLIPPSVQSVVKRAEQKSKIIATQTSDGAGFGDFYFMKSECVEEVFNHGELQALVDDLKRRYGKWRVDVLVQRDVTYRVGRYLSETRNRWGIREYENYHANGINRRWLPMRFVTALRLRQIMQETRVLERDIHLKGEGYHIALERLEQLEAAGKRVRMGDIMEEIGPVIHQYRLTGKVPNGVAMMGS